MISLDDVIIILKQEGRWEPFVKIFIKMRNNLVKDFIARKYDNIIDVYKTYGKLELIEQIIGLEDYSRQFGDS